MEHKHDSHPDSHGHHVTPMRTYFLTLAGLLVLTVLTVGASYINFGAANIVVALGIATAKAALVMLFFMGLKYDTNLNRAFILSAFVALALMISVGPTDVWIRAKPEPVKIKSTAGPLSQEEFNGLLAGSPELVARGKDLYAMNCAACHGDQGRGDGVAGAAFNPKPRDFTAPFRDWKNGNSVKSMYVTLAYGIPGTGMASYQALPVADRLAIIHYISATFVKEQEKESKVLTRFAQAVKEDGIGSGGAAPKQSLPIDFAIDRMSRN